MFHPIALTLSSLLNSSLSLLVSYSDSYPGGLDDPTISEAKNVLLHDNNIDDLIFKIVNEYINQ